MKNGKPSTMQELEAIKDAKIGTFFKVKNQPQTGTKDVDFSKRTVQVVTNTFYWFDSDYDVLVEGSTKKSINDRGPGSNASAKIKNLKDHQIATRIGVPQLMEERKIDGMWCQYAESKLLTNTAGNDALIEYQEGAIDQHSIGFIYEDIELITADATNWKSWVNKLINPEDAEDAGFMFIVREIKQHEFSPVSFGANSLTPYLGVKSSNPAAICMKAMERIDWLQKQYHKGKGSDDVLSDYNLQCDQLKQIISELFIDQPSIKDTLLAEQRARTQKGRPENRDTGFDVLKAIQETQFLNI